MLQNYHLCLVTENSGGKGGGKSNFLANSTYVFSVNTYYFKIPPSDRFLFFKRHRKLSREIINELTSLQLSYPDLYQSPLSSSLGDIKRFILFLSTKKKNVSKEQIKDTFMWSSSKN